MQAMRPCPIRVDVRSQGSETSVVLRIARNDGGVEREAAIFPALRRLGLPVPRVLVAPARDPAASELFAMMVIELLPGETLLARDDIERASLLLRGAYWRFQSTSIETPELAGLPRRTLVDDFDDVIRRGGPWTEVTDIQNALGQLGAVVRRIKAPLMFTNGDFQPGNFLTDGSLLTGMLDFEKAAFVDPLTVLTRFPVYDFRPLSRSGLVEAILEDHGYTPKDLAPRTAIFAIRTLQTKLPIEGGTAHQVSFRRHVLTTLSEALSLL